MHGVVVPVHCVVVHRVVGALRGGYCVVVDHVVGALCGGLYPVVDNVPNPTPIFRESQKEALNSRSNLGRVTKLI